jgi:hypothetical protein
MEKKRILNLVNKKISGAASVEETCELQSLLQKNIGISDAHKILLHLYNIESLVTSSELVQRQKLQKKQQVLIFRNETMKPAAKISARSFLSPHFFIRNNLFRIYCALTLRQLNRILC